MRSPVELWREAEAEHPGTTTGEVEERGRRYAELMREEGFLVPREPGDDSPLFACGYDPRAKEEP